MFLLNSRNPLVRFSSESMFRRAGLAREGVPCDRAFASSQVHRHCCLQPSKQLGVQARAPNTTSSEPILFPKLQIYFADFPYLHSSIDQRLLTLET